MVTDEEGVIERIIIIHDATRKKNEKGRKMVYAEGGGGGRERENGGVELVRYGKVA